MGFGASVGRATSIVTPGSTLGRGKQHFCFNLKSISEILSDLKKKPKHYESL